MQVAKTNIENMQVKSTIDGVVSAKENRDASGGFFTTGMVLPEYRAGDLVFSGRPLSRSARCRQDGRSQPRSVRPIAPNVTPTRSLRFASTRIRRRLSRKGEKRRRSRRT